ncbi:MAG: hypothetical protein Q8K75_00010 [Chlamydiales bacterium]|nr:hypothetical protein [Chlamydiales bacterium]
MRNLGYMLVATAMMATTIPTAEAINLRFMWQAMGYNNGEELLHMWNYVETQTASTDQGAVNAFVENWKGDRFAPGKKNIMKAVLNSNGSLYDFYVHDRYSYENDFEAYKAKRNEYAQEQLDTIGYLMTLALKNPRKMYALVLDYVETVTAQSGDEVWTEQVMNLVKSAQFQLIRSKLDISHDVLDANPEFTKFVISNDLMNAIMAQGHTIGYNKETLEPYLMANGKMTGWNEIQQELNAIDDGKMVSHVYNAKGLITLHGIQPLYTSGNPKNHGGGYAIQIVTRYNTFGQSYHSWVRLMDTDGTTFSFGFWGKDPNRSSITQALRGSVPFIENAGQVYSPDVFEDDAREDMLEGYENVLTSTFAISDKQYNNLLPYLAELTTKEGPTWGTNFRNNSASFVLDVLDQLSTLTEKIGSATRPLAQDQQLFALRSYMGFYPGAYQIWNWQTAEKDRRTTMVSDLSLGGASQAAIDAVKFAPPLKFAK